MRRRVYYADGEQLPVNPVLHVVAATILGPDTLVLSLSHLIMLEIFRDLLGSEWLFFVEEWDLAQEALVLRFVQIFRVLVDMLLVFDVDLEALLCEHGARDLDGVLVLRLEIESQGTMLVKVLEVGGLILNFLFYVLLLHFDGRCPVDHCKIASLLSLHLELRQCLLQMVVNSLEERILFLLRLELEVSRHSDVRAPALRLLQRLVAAWNDIDAFQFTVNHEAQFLVKKLLKLENNRLHNGDPRVSLFFLLHFLILRLLIGALLPLEKVVVELTKHLPLTFAYKELGDILSYSVGLAAALFQVVFVNVGAASSPATIHHDFVVGYSQFRRGNAPLAGAKVWLWIVFAVAAI